MLSLSLGASVAVALGVYAIYTISKLLYDELTSPLRKLPGPKSDHWMLGNRQQMFKNFDGQEGRWTKEYGRNIRINGFFGFSNLYTTDTKAIQHVLSHSYIYQKPAQGRYSLGRIVGPGVLVVEEDEHKKQRRIMNPAFGPTHLRALTSLFVEKSKQLRDIWTAKATQSGGSVKLNVIPEFSTAALDIIGKAGFNYDFKSLGSAPSHGRGNVRDELHEAFTKVSAVGDMAKTLLGFLRMTFPLLRPILPKTKIDYTIDTAQGTMRRIGMGLLEESKRQAMAGAESHTARDLLSLLVRANMDKDIPESQRMSDDDVLAQVPTFLVAGHETTSTAASWTIYELAKNPELQSRLREDLLSLDNDTPSMDDLNSLPYLDCVVRETLRANAPVPITFRTAMRDDIIPLGTPYTDRNGLVHDTLEIRKGQWIVIPILSVNRDPDIWGADSLEYIPERWQRTPSISTNIPGVWSQMLSFLGGPRACIGFRFSIIELKALLFTLVRTLEFELAVPAGDVGRTITPIVQLPIVRSDVDAGSQLPVLIKPFVPA
ncbi:cytochrome P450 [Favolaschia claudopus]|uniref:Cytochrome P450 n=1 Tax=Favolaschia claudopus TaxID=2862362 RepID=A0AAW0CUX8_9AGAR